MQVAQKWVRVAVRSRSKTLKQGAGSCSEVGIGREGGVRLAAIALAVWCRRQPTACKPPPLLICAAQPPNNSLPHSHTHCSPSLLHTARHVQPNPCAPTAAHSAAQPDTCSSAPCAPCSALPGTPLGAGPATCLPLQPRARTTGRPPPCNHPPTARPLPNPSW